jgi:Uma2 family endonuclease
LSTEPDILFASWETIRSGRLRWIEGKPNSYLELEGTPDMALEVISRSSVRKDTEILRERYWKAGVPEYWLVDARGPTPRFEMLRHAETGYVAVEPQDGWLFSAVFNRFFRLTQQTNPFGQPEYVLEVKTDLPNAVP